MSTQHPDDEAVDQFAAMLKQKLTAARAKGRGGWRDPDWPAETINDQLHQHAAKGDPLDVAAYAMFLALRGEATTEDRNARRFRWLAERTAATGLARWAHPFQFLAEAVDERMGTRYTPCD